MPPRYHGGSREDGRTQRVWGRSGPRVIEHVRSKRSGMTLSSVLAAFATQVVRMADVVLMSDGRSDSSVVVVTPNELR